jgi:hypothetical protein
MAETPEAAKGPEPKAVTKRPVWKHLKFWKYLFYFVGIPLICFALYVWLTLKWSFSDGDRSGVLQKLSHKGWICKTYEGELMLTPTPGALPEKFLFTVRDDALATKMKQALGRKVVLTYAEHPGVPTTCFGETEYFVKDVRVVE